MANNGFKKLESRTDLVAQLKDYDLQELKLTDRNVDLYQTILPAMENGSMLYAQKNFMVEALRLL